MSLIERQELFCHECYCYVQFDLDLSLDGNYVLVCPNCGHKHYRVVKNKKITSIRWDRGSGSAIIIHANDTTYSKTSTWNSYCSTASTKDVNLYNSWMNTTTLA